MDIAPTTKRTKYLRVTDRIESISEPGDARLRFRSIRASQLKSSLDKGTHNMTGHGSELNYTDDILKQLCSEVTRIPGATELFEKVGSTLHLVFSSTLDETAQIILIKAPSPDVAESYVSRFKPGGFEIHCSFLPTIWEGSVILDEMRKSQSTTLLVSRHFLIQTRHVATMLAKSNKDDPNQLEEVDDE